MQLLVAAKILIAALLRRKVLALAVFLTVLGASLSAYLLVGRRYNAEALLLVGNGVTDQRSRSVVDPSQLTICQETILALFHVAGSQVCRHKLRCVNRVARWWGSKADGRVTSSSQTVLKSSLWSKRMWAGRARDLRTAVASREVTPVSECLSTQMKRTHR